MDGDLSIIMERAANETTLECDRFGNCFESDDVPFWLTKVCFLVEKESCAIY